MYMPLNHDMLIDCLCEDGRIQQRLSTLEKLDDTEMDLLKNVSVDSLQRLRLCVLVLPEKQQRAVRETYCKGEKVLTAARTLHWSRNTVSKYRKEGLCQLSVLYHSEYTDRELKTLAVQTLLGKKQPV